MCGSKPEKSIFLSQTVTCDDVQKISTSGCQMVVDLRIGKNGEPRAIEEPVLKKLRNYFVGYEQVPVSLIKSDTGSEKIIRDLLDGQPKPILLIADEIEVLADLCRKSIVEVAVDSNYLSGSDYCQDMFPVVQPRIEFQASLGELR